MCVLFFLRMGSVPSSDHYTRLLVGTTSGPDRLRVASMGATSAVLGTLGTPACGPLTGGQEVVATGI